MKTKRPIDPIVAPRPNSIDPITEELRDQPKPEQPEQPEREAANDSK